VLEGRTINVRLVEERDDEPKGKSLGKDANKVVIYRHVLLPLFVRRISGYPKIIHCRTPLFFSKVFVTGLTSTTTDEKLAEMCEEFGLVLKAAVARHSVTGMLFIICSWQQC
jgi:hypothetical protein